MADGRIRVGIGGWNFEPWRDNFYPRGWPQARELEYASRRLSAIEINSTYYGAQKPATFAKWRRETPEGFVFSLKAIRFATQRRVLADGAESIRRFIDSGVAELGDKLGPIVWQLAPTHRFDAADLGAFLELLPASVDGLRLRHVLDVRHASFQCPEYLGLARRFGAATVFTESDDYPPIAEATGDFVYTRIMRTDPGEPLGCGPEVFPALAASARAWAEGREPEGLPRIEPPSPAIAPPRDVFCFFISGAKERAPQAAMALRRALGEDVGA
ncbi:DUF72 domain-containing protein [Roseateles saccharophilus]|uniref:Uncharacterized protein YecE (DUF72 family) n=1 Tax=Roseateles saccharophilus TaxID=304 RepID=A0A4R3UAK3_ROSSA|nr:DUF72 domain-containing protein [Roseateles saccharophilus]MDG0835825.1 DUF72 domain-containing protein [Roseateles saccharophilus]TCU83410.1 uncharacterized protein YecE (DUF72 family) [Roseateles saccharophilus]